MIDCIPEFGVCDSGVDYILRPGGYVVALNGAGKLAVVTTSRGVFLPGGGQEDGESAEAAAMREAAEECGLQIELGDSIGVADELVFSVQERLHYRKRCAFFRANVVETGLGMEAGHVLAWISPGRASGVLSHGSQRWAVENAFA